MSGYTYLDFLAAVGIGSAHPGGFTLTKQLLQQFDLKKETKLLEVGSGTGRTAAYIKKQFGCDVSAVEKNEVMIEKARARWVREKLNVDVIQGEAEELPFQNKQFHIVLGESVFAFTKKEKAVEECYRVLKEEGMLVCIEMVIEQHIKKQDEERIAAVYGIDEILTESEWLKVFLNSGFGSVNVIGGATIAQTIAAYAEQPEFHVSYNFSNELYEMWSEHERILRTYHHVLGHRVFLCKK